MTTERARIVHRRTPSFPFRNASYFDCTKWGGGYVRVSGAPGAVVLNRHGTMLNISSGEISYDKRFDACVPLTRDEAARVVDFYVDDALSPRSGKDMPSNLARYVVFRREAVRPMVVAVWSYLSVTLTDEEAEEVAKAHLADVFGQDIDCPKASQVL